MVYRRRRYASRARRPIRKYRRPRTRWSAKKRRPGVYYFKRFTGNLGNINLGAGQSNAFASFSFSLDQVPNASEFVNLYDMYKINRVKIMAIPVSNVTLFGDLTPEVFRQTEYSNRFFSVLDYNDSGVFTSVNQAREYQNCKVTMSTKIHKRYFKPRVALDVISGLGYNPKSQWLSTANITTPHYGIKFAYEGRTNTTSAAVTLYKLEAVFYMSFRNPR